VVEGTAVEMYAKVAFGNISLIAILAGNHPQRKRLMRHSPLASENLTNNQP